MNSSIKNVEYIGPLSRLKKLYKAVEYDIAIILSGPEPSRSKFEQKLLDLITPINDKRIALVRGTKNGKEIDLKKPNLLLIERANTKTINEILCKSECVISRAGYTSIMDYHALGIKSILIPTESQSEQEYLGQYLDDKYGHKTLKETELNELLELL